MQKTGKQKLELPRRLNLYLASIKIVLKLFVFPNKFCVQIYILHNWRCLWVYYFVYGSL